MRYARTDIPPAYPPLDGGELWPAAEPGVAGEFDTVIDPRFPEFFATNLSEAFPGPMTPLSLTASLEIMHASSDGMADFLGLTGDVKRELQARGAAVFGHRMYAGVSVVRKMAEAMPGMTPEDVDHQFLGLPRAEGSANGRAKPTVAELGDAARLLAHVGPQIAGFEQEVVRSEAKRRAISRAAEIEHLERRQAPQLHGQAPGELVEGEDQSLELPEIPQLLGNRAGELVEPEVQGGQVGQAGDNRHLPGEAVLAEGQPGDGGPGRVALDPLPGALGAGRAQPAGAVGPARAAGGVVEGDQGRAHEMLAADASS